MLLITAEEARAKASKINDSNQIYSKISKKIFKAAESGKYLVKIKGTFDSLDDIVYFLRSSGYIVEISTNSILISW